MGLGRILDWPQSDVAVWTGELSTADAASWRLLDGTERARAERFVGVTSRQRFVAAHAAVRRILGGVLGVDPASVTFERAPCVHCGAPHGKPVVDGPHSGVVELSLSRSGGAVAVAVAPAAVPVGIDIERCRTVRAEHLAARWFTPTERRFVGHDSTSSDRFLRLWTRKEALLKATAEGVPGGLASVEVLGTDWNDKGPLEVRRHDLPWQIADVEPPLGYLVAVACRGQQTVSRHPLPGPA